MNSADTALASSSSFRLVGGGAYFKRPSISPASMSSKPWPTVLMPPGDLVDITTEQSRGVVERATVSWRTRRASCSCVFVALLEWLPRKQFEDQADRQEKRVHAEALFNSSPHAGHPLRYSYYLAACIIYIPLGCSFSLPRIGSHSTFILGRFSLAGSTT